jgi:hypothetical protein
LKNQGEAIQGTGGKHLHLQNKKGVPAVSRRHPADPKTLA